MNYFIAYLALGVLTLAAIALDSRIRNSRRASDWSQISDLVLRSHQPWPEAILERLVLPVIAGAAIIAAWPIAIAFASYFYQRKKSAEASSNPHESEDFTVEPSDLIARLTIAQIEETELVYDPLQAVPRLPFGHMNCAWIDFKRQIKAADEIWSFRARWGNYRHPTAVRFGYASKRQGTVVTFFVAKVSPVTSGTG